MVAGAPVTTLTGADIQQLAAYISNLLAQTRQAGLNSAGYSDYGALGIGQGYGPNLAMLSLQAARDDANRNYGLNLQRYGLDYANTAFNQAMSAASHQLATLDLQTRRSGPEDWLRYNYVVNNAPGAPAPTVGAQAPQPPAPTVGGPVPMPVPGQLQLAPPQGNPNLAADQLKAQQLSDLWNKGDFTAFHNAGGTAATPSDPWGGSAPAPDSNPDTRSDVPGTQAAGWTDMTKGADGSLSAGGYTWDPNGTEGIHKLAYGGVSGRVPMLALGGGGMHAAVVGDPQRGNRANPEMVMSRAPIFVKPLQGENAAGPEARKAAKKLPHYATGGVTGGFDDLGGAYMAPSGGTSSTGRTAPSSFSGGYADAPFVSKVTQGGGAAFGGRGENLGPYGTAPIDYGRFLQLLPSEQAMTKGYIETPKDQGGLGGWFPDEMERARRASFQGLSLGQSGYAA